MAIFCCRSASAGSVEIGFVDSAGFNRWVGGAPAQLPIGEMACQPAKFDETSACGNLVISNDSSQAITVSFKTSSEEFFVGSPGAFSVFGFGIGHVPMPCSAINVGGHLEPGASCFEPVEFWPRTGDVRRATIQVTVENRSGSTTTSFKVKGTSIYPPELQAAEEVRERHEGELKKIQHVASVELDNLGKGGIKINVTVTDEDDIEGVRRQVPSKIEGYDTEVTEFVEHAYAF